MFALNTIRDVLNKANDKVGGYLWAIFAAAVVLLIVILFLVIAKKNKRIKKLKKEIKATRLQLETEREQAEKDRKAYEAEAERDRRAYEAAVASIDAAIDAALEDDDTQTEEIDSAPEPGASDGSERVRYFNRTSVVSSKTGGTVKFTVKYDRTKDCWVIKKEGVNRIVRKFDTKEEAMTCARALCKQHNANLVVHKKDGKFQKQ